MNELDRIMLAIAIPSAMVARGYRHETRILILKNVQKKVGWLPRFIRVWYSVRLLKALMGPVNCLLESER